MTVLPSTRPLNIAHRGARSLAPENTLAAARSALELGADLWELDTTLSADGELVVIHDDTLPRTSNAAAVFPERQPWAVDTFTLAELRRLDFGAWFNERDPFGQIAAGAVSAAMQRGYVGEPIPTLREALIFTRENRWKVNIEIKDAGRRPGDSDIVEKTVALVEELQMTGAVLISSFKHAYLRRVKAANPRIATAALVETGPADAVGLVRGLGAQAYHPGSSIDPRTIAAIRAAGIDVNVWTVNDPAMMRALIAHRASGIITDFPQVLNLLFAEDQQAG